MSDFSFEISSICNPRKLLTQPHMRNIISTRDWLFHCCLPSCGACLQFHKHEEHHKALSTEQQKKLDQASAQLEEMTET